MHEYVSFVLTLVREDGALALLVTVLVLAALVVGHGIRRRRGKVGGFSRGRALALALLAGYLAALCSMTVTGRSEFGFSSTNLHLFRAWREAWNSFSVKNWLLVLLNVAAFVPLGVLLPLVARPFRRWYITVPAGGLLSLAIETLQLLTGRGTFDVDDLFTNTLGGALGYCLVLILLCLASPETRSPRRWLPYLACPALFAGAVAGIFAAYCLQPYGNLSIAPSYSTDLRAVRWSTDLELDGETATAMVYKAPSMTQSDCVRFGNAFAETAGIAFPDAYYYDAMTIFANHSSGDFLSVDYRDGSYVYRLGDPLTVETTEAGLRQALEKLGIAVPAGAVFSLESEGNYLFSADFLQEAGEIYHGDLLCCVRDGLLTEVDQRLISLTPQAEAQILSEAEAYDQLRRGNFSSANRLTGYDTVSVTACTLDYLSDTKGYYQPVYRFALATGDKILDDALIPALR